MRTLWCARCKHEGRRSSRSITSSSRRYSTCCTRGRQSKGRVKENFMKAVLTSSSPARRRTLMCTPSLSLVRRRSPIFRHQLALWGRVWGVAAACCREKTWRERGTHLALLPTGRTAVVCMLSANRNTQQGWGTSTRKTGGEQSTQNGNDAQEELRMSWATSTFTRYCCMLSANRSTQQGWRMSTRTGQ